MKKKILFLCTGNSCRSQMAEGFAKKFLSDKFDFYSAGIEKYGMNKRAMQVMAEKGVDLSSHTSKILEEMIMTQGKWLGCTIQLLAPQKQA